MGTEAPHMHMTPDVRSAAGARKVVTRRALVTLAAAGVSLALAHDAQAQTVIKSPGAHPHYAVELEPHLLFGWNAPYAGNGFGLGGRVSVPVTHRGFISSINNSVAIGFGIDWLHYGQCYYYHGGSGYGCGADYFELPVVMQWNFYLTRHWSVFAEPGFYIYHGAFADNYCGAGGVPACAYPAATSADVAFWAGGRYQFTDTVALTMRIGYPTLSVGVSFMP